AAALSKLEPREAMLSKIAGLVKSEMTKAAGVFQAAQGRFLSLLEAYKEKVPGDVSAEAEPESAAAPEADAEPASAPEPESSSEPAPEAADEPAPEAETSESDAAPADAEVTEDQPEENQGTEEE